MHRLTGAAGSLPQCPTDPIIITPPQNHHAHRFFGAGCPGARCRRLVASHATHPRRDCNTCESRTELCATRSDPGTLIDPIPRPSPYCCCYLHGDQQKPTSSSLGVCRVLQPCNRASTSFRAVSHTSTMPHPPHQRAVCRAILGAHACGGGADWCWRFNRMANFTSSRLARTL